MRFLIREMEYEKPIASGILRYEQDGVPTGLEESWRFSSALNGFHFLRVEVDTNESGKQETQLYHLVLNSDKELERLKFRHFSLKTEINGDIQFDDDSIFLHRVVLNKSQKSEERHLDEIRRESESALAVPSMVVLSLVASRVVSSGLVPVIMIDADSSFELREELASFSWGKEEERVILRDVVAVRPCSIRLSTKKTRLWLDRNFWPVSASLSGGLTAREIAYWRYQSAVKTEQKIS